MFRKACSHCGKDSFSASIFRQFISEYNFMVVRGFLDRNDARKQEKSLKCRRFTWIMFPEGNVNSQIPPGGNGRRFTSLAS